MKGNYVKANLKRRLHEYMNTYKCRINVNEQDSSALFKSYYNLYKNGPNHYIVKATKVMATSSKSMTMTNFFSFHFKLDIE